MRIGDWSSDVCSSDLACLLDRNGGNCLCGIWTADANPEARARAKSIMGACRLPKPVLIARLTRWHPPVASRQSGRSSGVEHNLAKVGVEGSNPFEIGRASGRERVCQYV